MLQRLNFVQAEKETMSDLPQFAEISAGIVVHGGGNLNFALKRLLDGFNGGRFAFERHVKNVGAVRRPNADSITFSQLNAEHLNTLRSNRLGERIPALHCLLLRAREAAQYAMQ